MNAAETFPTDGRRALIYAIWDRRGGVEDYVRYALEHLRPHVDRLLVVVNGTLDDAGRAALESVTDEVLVRENTGFDIGAHQYALAHLGGALADYDEVILCNDTWFGPVRPFGPLFERMDARAVDFLSLIHI